MELFFNENAFKFQRELPTMVGNVYLGSSSLAIVKTYLYHLALVPNTLFLYVPYFSQFYTSCRIVKSIIINDYGIYVTRFCFLFVCSISLWLQILPTIISLFNVALFEILTLYQRLYPSDYFV